jgi:hypothetical protein
VNLSEVVDEYKRLNSGTTPKRVFMKPDSNKITREVQETDIVTIFGEIIEPHLQRLGVERKYATEAELEKIEEHIMEVVNDSVTFSENSPYPDASELYEDVYFEPNYPFIKE